MFRRLEDVGKWEWKETYSLKNLFPPDIIQPHVEVLDARSQILQLVLVQALDRAGLANGNVQREADAAVGRAERHPVVAPTRR